MYRHNQPNLQNLPIPTIAMQIPHDMALQNGQLGNRGQWGVLEFRHLMANPKTRAVWSHSYGNKLGQLTQGMPGGHADTNTTVFIHHPFRFIDDASISSPSCPIYAMLVSREIEGDQSYLNDDGLSPEEQQRGKDEREAAMVRKQAEADLGGFDMEQDGWRKKREKIDSLLTKVLVLLLPCRPVNTSSGSLMLHPSEIFR
jgi:hypothetical protein